MYRRLATACAALALVAVPHIASAQIEKGDSQVSLQGSLSTNVGGADGSSSTSGNVGGTYGYYFTRQLALRGVAFITASKSAGGGSGADISGVYGGGIELNLTGANQAFVPYIAFDALTSSSSSGSQGSVLLGPSVGARAFVSRNTAFNVALQYQTFSDNTNVGTLQTSFGFSVFFGGDRRR
jgi:hypothetical protein